MDGGAWQSTLHGVAESDTTEHLSTAQHTGHHKGIGFFTLSEIGSHWKFLNKGMNLNCLYLFN